MVGFRRKRGFSAPANSLVWFRGGDGGQLTSRPMRNADKNDDWGARVDQTWMAYPCDARLPKDVGSRLTVEQVAYLDLVRKWFGKFCFAVTSSPKGGEPSVEAVEEARVQLAALFAGDRGDFDDLMDRVTAELLRSTKGTRYYVHLGRVWSKSFYPGFRFRGFDTSLARG